MKENSAQKSTQAANLVTVDLPPNPATNPLNTLRPPHWPPVPSPAVCLFIFYARVGVQVCLAGASLLCAEWTSAAGGLSGLSERHITLLCMLLVCLRVWIHFYAL